MKLTDALGNELNRGDLVTLKIDQIVGVISEVDSGEIARGVSIAGTQPKGEVHLPVIVVQIQLTTGLQGPPNGVFQNLLKIAKPEKSSDVDKLVKQ